MNTNLLGNLIAISQDDDDAMKSKGHITFALGTDEIVREFFVRGDEILVAPVSNVIMPDGFRCGRFEGRDTDLTRDMLTRVWFVPFGKAPRCPACDTEAGWTDLQDNGYCGNDYCQATATQQQA